MQPLLHENNNLKELGLASKTVTHSEIARPIREMPLSVLIEAGEFDGPETCIHYNDNEQNCTEEPQLKLLWAGMRS